MKLLGMKYKMFHDIILEIIILQLFKLQCIKIKRTISFKQIGMKWSMTNYA